MKKMRKTILWYLGSYIATEIIAILCVLLGCIQKQDYSIFWQLVLWIQLPMPFVNIIKVSFY